MNKMLFAFKDVSKNFDFFIILIYLESNMLESSFNQKTLNICHSSETHIKDIPSAIMSHQSREAGSKILDLNPGSNYSWLYDLEEVT